MPISIDMEPTRFVTLQVPAMGANNQAPALITKAARVPQRLVIRNIGAVAVLIASSQSALQNVGQTAGAYEIPISRDETVIIAVDQQLFISAIGAVGRVSVMISDAWPLFNGQPVSC